MENFYFGCETNESGEFHVITVENSPQLIAHLNKDHLLKALKLVGMVLANIILKSFFLTYNYHFLNKVRIS